MAFYFFNKNIISISIINQNLQKTIRVIAEIVKAFSCIEIFYHLISVPCINFRNYVNNKLIY